MNLTPEQIAARLVDRNPFATRSVRPGALSFRFENGSGVEEFLQRLRENRWVGAIVGPHGSGKTTLLQTLIPALEHEGRTVRLFTLQPGESRLPIAGTEMKNWGPTTQVIVDGYEQLGNWTRTLLTRICARQGCGMLITTHAPTQVPTLYQIEPDLTRIQSIVRDMQNRANPRITDSDVAVSFARKQGNVREVFFELYDVYEQRREL